jgi:hypothetical protein
MTVADVMPALPKPITDLLEPNEEVLWKNQPRPYVFMLRGLPAIFYGLVFSILGAYYHRATLLAPWDDWWRLMPTFSLPFIALGWSFFIYPINLGARARFTWYIVTTRRVMIVRLHTTKQPELRIFTHKEMGPPHVIRRFDGLYEVILARAQQAKPYIVPRLESGFFGIADGPAAANAVNSATNP